MQTQATGSLTKCGVTYQIKYTDDYGQALQAEKNEELKVVSPFQISHRLKNSYNVALDSVLINEDLKLTCTIKNTSSTVLRITRVSLTTEVKEALWYQKYTILIIV